MALPVAARWACDQTATIIGDAMLDRYVYGDVSGTLNETRHLYYTEPSKWQVVEERVGTSSSTNRQFVWGLRYIDDLILRDRDTDGNGTLDERLYSLQDANWNVTGLVNTSGVIQQRFVYARLSPTSFTDTFGSFVAQAGVGCVVGAGSSLLTD